MPKRLTDRTLQALKPAKAGKRYDVMDADVRGFASASPTRGNEPSFSSPAIRAALIPPEGRSATIRP
jgi:hypothetical protein